MAGGEYVSVSTQRDTERAALELEKQELGRTGMQVTPLGFGGAEIGFESASLDTVRKLLNAALDAGLNVIDTAPNYESGYSEEIVGRAVRGSPRERVFVIDKVDEDGGNKKRYDRFRDRIMFPIRNTKGQVIGFC